MSATEAPRRQARSISAMPPLLALPSAPATVRAFTGCTLAEWRMNQDLSDTVKLVATEITTNAVTASSDAEGHPVTPDGQVRVIMFRLLLYTECLIVEVRDQAPGVPTVRDPGTSSESGRGLWIVDAEADNWGWYALDDRQPGKIVWAEFRFPRVMP